MSQESGIRYQGSGWDFFDVVPEGAVKTSVERAKLYARVFQAEDGAAVLRDLFERVNLPVPANQPDAVLRHHEGRRWLVREIMMLVNRGKKGE